MPDNLFSASKHSPAENTTAAPCPLCAVGSGRHFAEVNGRRYLRCPNCLLTWLAPAQRPDADAELAEYGHHDNRPDDPGYRRFLNKAVEPLCLRLAEKGVAQADGLDFGCGPGPTLSVMMDERGHRFVDFDPFFRPDGRLLKRRYDAIACTEVAEHFHDPTREFTLLDSLLVPGGVLAVMTSILYDDDAFAGWHYIRELSHVVFYRPETMVWIATQFGWSMTAPSPTVRLFEKA
ncbi:class I SAM-dependent methyltransferase [Fodinicurvata sp. EGI_FJ10296]|uniref:class I SAM-dependent methyltransferase n=1 Tax=Fodinicurvata sp. EGI_FJ10296 TaxID=3231908 RepID=UPI003456479D